MNSNLAPLVFLAQTFPNIRFSGTGGTGNDGERRGTAGTGMEIPEIVSKNFLETPVGDPDHPDLQALIKLELLVICRPFVG